MKTKKIGLIGGPGSGKTILAHQICAELRKQNKDARVVLEYATEYIRDYGPPCSTFDQLIIFLEQTEAEQKWKGYCEYLISESPPFLVCCYAQILKEIIIKTDGEKKHQYLIRKLYAWARENSIPSFDLIIFLPPVWKLQKDKIRTQTSSKQMKDISRIIKSFLVYEQIKHKAIGAKDDKKRIHQAMQFIKHI